MKKNLGLKTAIIIVTLLVFVWGMFFGKHPEAAWKAFREKGPMAALGENLSLGLDLRGGTHLILQVMVDEAVAAETDRTAERLKEQLTTQKIPFGEIARGQRAEQAVIKGVPTDRVGDVRTLIGDEFLDYDLTSSPENDLLVTMKPQALTQLKNTTVSRSIETIRGRVDALGVTEPVIQEHGLGEHQILVQLPGVDDPVRVRQIMQETGMLEYRLALRPDRFPTEQEALASFGGVLPGNAEILPDGQRGVGGFWVVTKNAVVSGEDIRRAVPSVSETGQQEVQFDLTAAAGKRFAAFTGANIGNPLAVVLNRRVRQVATIQSEIADSGRITGAFSQQEAADLSKLLESGALPASIRYLEDRTVGASLGAESIRQGVTAGLVGLALVVIAMLVYYKGAGINANLGLFLNVIILLGFLGFTGATLTLPGIAGVILTIGMGVDSNVLIFERIREELRAGKSVSAAVDHGFARAWLTIIDTHVTVVVSAIILFLFGSGPVRGFAVTLTFGLLANLFTAVFVSRVIFDAILARKQRNEALSI